MVDYGDAFAEDDGLETRGVVPACGDYWCRGVDEAGCVGGDGFIAVIEEEEEEEEWKDGGEIHWI